MVQEGYSSCLMMKRLIGRGGIFELVLDGEEMQLSGIFDRELDIEILRAVLVFLIHPTPKKLSNLEIG
jgi:hypothetical protein